MLRTSPAFALLLLHCISPMPPLDPEDAGPPAVDSFVPPPAPEVVALRARGRDGHSWPLDRAPRRPLLELELSRPAVAGDEPDAFVLEDTPTEPLLDDLRRAPLLVAHQRRVIPTTLERSAERITLTPDAPLVPGARYFVALAGWARADDGAPFAPFVAPFVVAEAASGATPLGTWPPDGAAGVPPELELAVVRFDDDITGTIRLEGPDGAASTTTERVPCDALGWSSGVCLVLRWDGLLRPASRYALVVGADARDRTGAPLEPWRSEFQTGQPGGIGFNFVPLACELDEVPIGAGCALADDRSVRIRLLVDRPVRGFLLGPTRSDRTVAPRGEVVLELDGLDADAPVEPELRLVGLDGSSHVERLALRTTPPLATLTIAEVCADPRGPEPRQEWVELSNYGPQPVSLQGLAISDRVDRLGDVILPALVLPANGRALLVADGFDPDHPDDPAVPEGTLLVRIGTSLASGGLSNSGEPLLLRDADGHRVATVPAIPSAGPGRCIHRVGGPRGRATEDFRMDTCTPGAP
jgi:hypothetical protein